MRNNDGFLFRSHDGYEDVDGVLEARTDKYATQRRVFDNLGQGVLDNAFEGNRVNTADKQHCVTNSLINIVFFYTT